MALVLVVEDQDENLDLMVYLLTAFGHETLVARDGAEGLAVAAQARPDLVVMDLQMPVMDGYEAASRLKEDAGLVRHTARGGDRLRHGRRSGTDPAARLRRVPDQAD